MRSSLVLLAWTLPALVACGGSLADGDDAPGGTGTGGAGTGGAAAGGPQCAAFDDALPLHVEVVLRNGTAEWIFVGQDSVTCSQLPFFQVKDASGAELSQSHDQCGSGCAALRDGVLQGCAEMCPYPQAINLAPGEAVVLGWDGNFGSPETLPTECLPAGADATACTQQKRAPAGTLTFSAAAGTTPDCQLGEAQCSSCSNDSGGGCWWPATLVSDLDQFEASAELVFAPDGSGQAVELVFED